MAVSNKKIKSEKFLYTKEIKRKEDPDKYYSKHPSWNFHTCDLECWPFSKEIISRYFESEILPKFKDWEKMTWHDILIKGKKLNHSVAPESLNSKALKRLEDNYCLEAASLISLRLNGTHRLYGYMIESTFNIIWYDENHGDNSDCVCRSHLKHT